MNEKQDQVILCETCAKESLLKDMVASKEVGIGVTEWGLVCPHCQTYTHSFYETPKILQARDKLNSKAEIMHKAKGGNRSTHVRNYQEQRVHYGNVFKEEQSRWQKKRSQG